MEILKFPHPALLTYCKEVTVFGEELRLILDKMYETMIQAKGIGLAANQVGLDIRAFVMVANGERLDLVNPVITGSSRNLAYVQEGCLSAPGERIDTGNRSAWVNINYQDADGVKHAVLFGGIESVCVQHELEHLDGKAFFQTNTITKTKRIKLCKKWGVKFK